MSRMEARIDRLGLPYVEPPSSCCATCAHYENVLAISHATLGRAGLSDRYSMLRILANLAGALCARLHVGRPCNLLSSKHNYGEQQLDCAIPWSRYFDVVWVDKADGPVLIEHERISSQVERTNGSTVQLIDTKGSTSDRQLAAQYLTALRIRGSNHQRFRWTWDVKNGLPLAALRSSLINRLVLSDLLGDELLPNLWGEAKSKTDKRGHTSWSLYVHNESYASQACVYARQPVSVAIQQLAGRFMLDHRLEPRTFLSVHLRRGDATVQCDSSVARVVAWLKCSPFWQDPIPNASRHGRIPPSPLTLLLFTDETDASYLGDMTRALQGLQVLDRGAGVSARSGGSIHTIKHGGKQLARGTQPRSSSRPAFARVIHVDPLLRQLSAERGVQDDNYFVYLLGLTVQANALAGFERRRTINCEACARSIIQRQEQINRSSSVHGFDFRS